MQARKDEATRAQLSRKTANKMARAELIEAQRQALLLEMQHIRKDILQQEAWLRVSPCHPPPLPSPFPFPSPFGVLFTSQGPCTWPHCCCSAITLIQGISACEHILTLVSMLSLPICS